MKKFKMELTWHNCLECPPKELTNDCLIATDGTDVFETFWYRPNGFMIRGKDRWYDLYKGLNKWYWADIRQTVQEEKRFKEESL